VRYQLKSERVLTCNVGVESVIMDSEQGVYYRLNEVSACLWSLLDRERSFEELRAIVLEQFEVSAEQADADLKLLMKELIELELVQCREA